MLRPNRSGGSRRNGSKKENEEEIKRAPAPPLGRARYPYLETLGLLAAIETDRLQRAKVYPRPTPGRLGLQQERILRDYIDDKLDQKLSLSTLADLLDLSRFHFGRSLGHHG